MSAQKPSAPHTPQAPGTKTPPGWRLIATGDWLAGQSFEIQPQTTLGRDGSCDITIAGTHLSRRHAQLELRGNRLYLRDLGSANGTFVNGKRIIDCEVRPGDELRFDVLPFRVEGPVNPQGATANATVVRPPVKPMDNPVPARKPQRRPEPDASPRTPPPVPEQPPTGTWLLLGTALALAALAALLYIALL